MPDRRPTAARIAMLAAIVIALVATFFVPESQAQQSGAAATTPHAVVAAERVPLGFSGAGEFGQFGSSLQGGLAKAGFGGTRAAFQGSSVTGSSFRTGAAFDVGRVSDFDIALAGDDIFNAARGAGDRSAIWRRPNWTTERCRPRTTGSDGAPRRPVVPSRTGRQLHDLPEPGRRSDARAEHCGALTMKTYDLYGTSQGTLAQLRDRVAPLLGLDFHERDSGYRGGLYFRAGELYDEHFVILANEADDPDDLPEPDFANARVLLEVNATLRPQTTRDLLSTIPELVLLRTKEI